MLFEIEFEDLLKSKMKCCKCGKFKKPSSLSLYSNNVYQVKCKKCMKKDFNSSIPNVEKIKIRKKDQ